MPVMIASKSAWLLSGSCFSIFSPLGCSSLCCSYFTSSFPAWLASVQKHDAHTYALFELTDANFPVSLVLSPAHLSLVPGFQRGWGSVYDALLDGRIDAKAVEMLLAQHPLEDGSRSTP